MKYHEAITIAVKDGVAIRRADWDDHDSCVVFKNGRFVWARLNAPTTFIPSDYLADWVVMDLPKDIMNDMEIVHYRYASDDRIREAIKVITSSVATDEDESDWIIDQVLRCLCFNEDQYQTLIASVEEVASKYPDEGYFHPEGTKPGEFINPDLIPKFI